MSALGPDEHSSTQYSEASEQHNAAESGSEYDLKYEPEREFVLMPLFRRIGEMLGIRRSPEPEYVYQPEQDAQQPVLRTVEPQQEVVLPETAIQYSEPQLPAETQVLTESALPDQPYQENVTHDQAEEDVLQLEPRTQQHASDNVVHESSEEFPQQYSEPIEIETQPEFTAPSQETADEPLIAARSEAPEMEPARSVVEEWPVPVQPASPSTATAHKRSPEEVRQLVAPLREAAVKITAIVAQAAEWLRAKEEEFLRSAETIAAESKQEQQSLRSASTQLDSRVEDSTASRPLQQTEVPAVQRELAWRDRSADLMGAREPLPAPIRFVAKPDRPLVPPAVPFWKRVNWAEEFTPKRVAVLGGLAMAILLVLGISFARRPASSVLPEQQTRSLEPGGVTVTTHPAAAPVHPQVLRKASAAERPSPVPRHRAPRATADDYDDGPDVIIHHYDTAKKPSPVKQTTVAGVRHYSDM
jgi:hypothetical protein